MYPMWTSRSCSFECDCGWSFHRLVLSYDRDCDYITFSLVSSPWDLTFLERLKAAFRIIKGEEHILSEIILNKEEKNKLLSFISSMEEE